MKNRTIVIILFFSITFSAVSQETDEFEKMHDIFGKLHQIRNKIIDISIFNNDDFSFFEFHETIEKIIDDYNELKVYYDSNDIILVIDFSINILNNIKSKSVDINSIVSELNMIIGYVDSLDEVLLEAIYLSHYRNNNRTLPNSIIESNDNIEINIDLHIREILKIIYRIKLLCHDMEILNYNSSLKYMNLIYTHIDAILNMNKTLEINLSKEERMHVTLPLIKLLTDKINDSKKYIDSNGNYSLSYRLDEIIEMYSIIRRLIYYYPIDGNNGWI